jgi:hypothetical protein
VKTSNLTQNIIHNYCYTPPPPPLQIFMLGWCWPVFVQQHAERTSVHGILAESLLFDFRLCDALIWIGLLSSDNSTRVLYKIHGNMEIQTNCFFTNICHSCFAIQISIRCSRNHLSLFPLTQAILRSGLRLFVYSRVFCLTLLNRAKNRNFLTTSAFRKNYTKFNIMGHCVRVKRLLLPWNHCIRLFRIGCR